MMGISQGVIDKNFALIEEAAKSGERCPQGRPHGPLQQAAVRQLTRSGLVRIEIYRYNWRVAVIMEGPNKGKATAPSPDGGKPYRVIWKDHTSLAGLRKIAP